MKTQIQKSIKSLGKDYLMQLLSFIEEEDLDFIQEMEYSQEELIKKTSKFFDNKDDSLIKKISKDLFKSNSKLFGQIFTKKDIQAKPPKPKSANNNSQLTENQQMVLNKINRLIQSSETGKIRTDSLTFKDKSKFFVGGVLTTLVERSLIRIEVENKRKFIHLIK